MNAKKLIAEYYTTARLLVKKGDSQAARFYVLQLLNTGLEIYKQTNDILSRIKNQVFLERWVNVSRDLYYKGITDYVLECFGLQTNNTERAEQLPEIHETLQTPENPVLQTDNSIDMSGLIDEAAQTQSWKEKVYNENKMATVEISGCMSGSIASGTGFIISDKGYLLTNDHVVFDEEMCTYIPKLYMSFFNDDRKYKIEVLFSDRKCDVALCKFNPEEVTEFKSVKRISDYSKVSQAQDCLIIGNAFGMGLSPLSGEIKFAKNSEGNLVHSAPSNHGDSGGPVFNRMGECIGINKSKTRSINGVSADGFTNATPMDKIDELLKKWTANNNLGL